MLNTVAELWLDWLRDEVKYADATDRTKVVTLFERAVKDYMCEAIFLVHCVQQELSLSVVFRHVTVTGRGSISNNPSVACEFVWLTAGSACKQTEGRAGRVHGLQWAAKPQSNEARLWLVIIKSGMHSL